MTIGMCLIYYGLAVLVYQIYFWWAGGFWTPYPLMKVWHAFFGTPKIRWQPLQDFVLWALDWPLSATLLFAGVFIVGSVLGLRLATGWRRRQQRRHWIVAQCLRLGYMPWKVPDTLARFDEADRHKTPPTKPGVG